jgi:signal transduction histidine kinase
MLPGVPWLALAMLATGVGALALLASLWSYRGRQGAWPWFGVIAALAVWPLSYGIGLLVFDPTVRPLLEIPVALAMNWAGVFFLAFALAYTGRGHLVRSWPMYGLVAFEVVSTAVAVTNPVHHLLFTDYRITPVFGVATASFEFGPWLYLQLGVTYLCIAVAFVALVETVVSYGPLYRKQAVALAVSPVLPVIASVVWLFELGPYPQINLVPLTFLPHLLLDYYALFYGDMFDLSPATKRAGERAAIDDIGSPVFVVDAAGRVIDANDPARSLARHETVLSERLSAVLGTEVTFDDSEQTVTLRVDGQRRVYNVVVSPFRTASGDDGGYTVVFEDVTAERQRKQRLEVLNRILRHNLRNDMNVVRMYADELETTADDPERSAMAATIGRKSDGLVELGEKARTAAKAMEERDSEVVDVRELLADVRAEVTESFPDATVRVDVPATVRVDTDYEALRSVFANAVENGVEHGSTGNRTASDDGAKHHDDDPTVEVVLVGTDEGAATFEIRDDGPGIPDHEVAVVEAGAEDALSHGSGIGLWLMKWATTTMGGDLTFSTDGGGTTVRVRVPGVIAGESERKAERNSGSETTARAAANRPEEV